MKIILNFDILLLLFIFDNGEIVKSVDDVIMNKNTKETKGTVKSDTAKYNNIRNSNTKFVELDSKSGVSSSTMIPEGHRFNTTTHTTSRPFFSSVGDSNVVSTALPIDLENSSMALGYTKSNMTNKSRFKNITQFSGNNNLMEVFSGKEVSVMQLTNGKQINIAKKVNQIVFGNGNDRNSKTKVGKLSEELPTGKSKSTSNLEDLFKKELDGFITIINCYRDISFFGQNSSNLSCSQDVDTSKNSIVKKTRLTKQKNIKLYGGISSLKFTFTDKGRFSEIIYEVSKV
uniref:Astacin domain-containing protein n=1 Tax=Strongyloides papillosus TaxID=174720 RepID=A0A0N5BBY7_STREA